VITRLRRRARVGIALPLPRRLRGAAPQPDEARVAPAARPPLGVRLLRGRRGARAAAGDGRRARSAERARDVHAAARDLRQRVRELAQVRAAPDRHAQHITEQGRVRPLAAVVCGDAREVEQRPDVRGRQLEFRGDLVARRLQPGIHGWQAIRVSKAPPYSAGEVDVIRLPGGRAERDAVAVEEPLEIRIDGEPVAVTMRTPGHDEELALGFCLTEGLAPRAASLPPDLAANTVDVDADGSPAPRNFYTSSSCGVCGKGALEAVAVEASHVDSRLRIAAALAMQLPDRLRTAQGAFAATGGLHATGLFA